MASRPFKDHRPSFELIDEQPVSSKVAFPSAFEITDEHMISKVGRKGLLVGNPCHDALEPRNVSSTLASFLEVLFKPVCSLQLQHLSSASNISSRLS